VIQRRNVYSALGRIGGNGGLLFEHRQAHELARSSSSAEANRMASRYAINPGRKLRLATKVTQAAKYCNENILRRILALFYGDAECSREAMNKRCVPFVQAPPSGHIPISAQTYELCIGNRGRHR
jgi:hypothetical protein